MEGGRRCTFLPNNTNPPTNFTASSLTLIAMSLNLSVTDSRTKSLDIKFGSNLVKVDKVFTTLARTFGKGSENKNNNVFNNFSKSDDKFLSVKIAL